MGRLLKRRLWIAVAAIAVVALGGGAYAATRGGSGSSPSAKRSAFLSDLAKRLGVTQAQLRSALQGAFFDQLDAAVAAGTLTKAQADAIKQRIQHSGFVPLGPRLGFGAGPLMGPGGFPGGGPRRFAGGGELEAAAGYLGLSNAQLADQLFRGQSLAQIAHSRGKSVAGLKQAMTAAVKARLRQSVASKLITSAQEQQLLSRLSSRLDQAINSSRGPRFGPPGAGPPGAGPPGAVPPGAVPPGAGPPGAGPPGALGFTPRNRGPTSSSASSSTSTPY